MSDKNEVAAGSLWSGLFQFGVYKRSQGRLIRQLTFFGLVAIVVLGCWSLSGVLDGEQWLKVGVPVGIAALGVWISFRLVNTPRFADFLIAVEVEMNKVSWPSRDELIRSSLVVIFTMLVLVVLLFTFDFLWNRLFHLIGIA